MKPEVNTRYVVKVLDSSSVESKVPLIEVTKGDIFTMYEEDGTVVENGQQWLAEEDAYEDVKTGIYACFTKPHGELLSTLYRVD